nr:DNA (cytosine-5-)-methyltransferase [uncultured Methanolobus sp.]
MSKIRSFCGSTKTIFSCSSSSIRKVPEHDILVAGFPCQPFSQCGLKRGFDDTRGTIFFEIARIVKQKQPRFLLFENVPGLLSNEGGETFKKILSTLDELGYDVQWNCLNSYNFGLETNRTRLFIIGHNRTCGYDMPEILPYFEQTADDVGVQQKASGERPWIPCITTRYGERYVGEVYVRQRKGSESIVRRLTPKELERIQGFPEYWTKFGVEWDKSDNMKARSSYLTTYKKLLKAPEENRIELSTYGHIESYVRDMPYPLIPVPDSVRYKVLGNAVTPNVVEAIGMKLLTEMELW